MRLDRVGAHNGESVSTAADYGMDVVQQWVRDEPKMDRAVDDADSVCNDRVGDIRLERRSPAAPAN
jgi:hypothetical protein